MAPSLESANQLRPHYAKAIRCLTSCRECLRAYCDVTSNHRNVDWSEMVSSRCSVTPALLLTGEQDDRQEPCSGGDIPVRCLVIHHSL